MRKWIITFWMLQLLAGQGSAIGKEPGSVFSIRDSGSTALAICSDRISFCFKGKQTVLHGANIPTALFVNTRWKWGDLSHFGEQLNILKGVGLNFVVIGYDPNRVRDAQYVSSIVKSAELAKGAGFFVELVQHHISADLQADDDRKKLGREVPIIDLGAEMNTNVSEAWRQFLEDPQIATRVSRVVDIVGIFSEPALYGEAGSAPNISWSQWRPRAERACIGIRERVGRPIVCSISGVNWGWDISGMLKDPTIIPGIALEVHHYKWHFDKGQTWEANVGALPSMHPVLVGEFGYTDPSDYVEKILRTLSAAKISWAAWPGPSRSWEDNVKSGNNQLIRLMEKYSNGN